MSSARAARCLEMSPWAQVCLVALWVEHIWHTAITVARGTKICLKYDMPPPDVRFIGVRIGAGATVTRDVPAGATVVGVNKQKHSKFALPYTSAAKSVKPTASKL